LYRKLFLKPACVAYHQLGSRAAIHAKTGVNPPGTLPVLSRLIRLALAKIATRQSTHPELAISKPKTERKMRLFIFTIALAARLNIYPKAAGKQLNAGSGTALTA